jgi:hypothetical protein
MWVCVYVPSHRERTKPELVGDTGVEDLLFTAWCGRMIPKAFSPGLPPLVAAAKASRDPDAYAWMLTHSRLWWVAADLSASGLTATLLRLLPGG